MSIRYRSVLIRIGILLVVVMVAFLASGVILAQSSADYDLGCRAELTAGGYAASYPGVGVDLHSSVGLWNSGTTIVQGSGIVIRSGYLLTSGAAALASSEAGETVEANEITQEPTYFLPAVYSAQLIRYVRPCNWPWANAAQVTP